LDVKFGDKSLFVCGFEFFLFKVRNMYKIIIAIFCFTCNSIVSHAQFILENEYSTNQLVRAHLQDQSERYFYFNNSKTELIYANENHQIIDSIPFLGCDGYRGFLTIRNDYEEFGMGVMVRCGDTTSNITSYRLIDNLGNVKKEFESAVWVDDNYILEINNDDYSTKIYETQSLEFIEELSNLKLYRINNHYDGLDYYMGNNGMDSIFVFDANLNIVSAVKFDLAGNLSETSIATGSIIEDTGELKSYFIITSRDAVTSEYQRHLIDEDGELLYNFQEDNASFHKYEQNLQVLYQHDAGLVSTYSISDDEHSPVITNSSTGSLGIYSSGEYIATRFDSQSRVVTVYDYTGQIALTFILDDPYAFYGFDPFTDHLGNEYFKYVQRIDNDYNTVILQDMQVVQVIDMANNMILSELPGLPFKLINFPNNNGIIGVYGLNLTNTVEIEQDEIILMPVPAKSKIFVNEIENYRNYLIYDINTKLIKKGEIIDSNLEIDIEKFKPGIYFLTLVRENHKFITKKFIKID